MAPDDEDDPKVKQLLNPATEADLARWFSLPSFQELPEEAQPVPEDKDMAAKVERRDRALAAVDPALLESLRMRNEVKPATLIRFEAKIDVHVDEQLPMFDERMVQRAASIAEPREVEISDELRDDLKECTPQALLRDLHRAEFDFDKTFEWVDHLAELRLDIVSEVATAMATNWKLPPLAASPLVEGRAVLDGVRAQRRRNWTEFLPSLARRRVRE
jgi:hypothetical protein